MEEYVSAVLLEISGLKLEVAGGGLTVSFELDEALGVPSLAVGGSRGAGFRIPDGGLVGGGLEELIIRGWHILTELISGRRHWVFCNNSEASVNQKFDRVGSM